MIFFIFHFPFLIVVFIFKSRLGPEFNRILSPDLLLGEGFYPISFSLWQATKCPDWTSLNSGMEAAHSSFA